MKNNNKKTSKTNKMMEADFSAFYDYSRGCALVKFGDVDALVQNGNRQKFAQIIANKWVVINGEYRVYASCNRHIEKLLKDAGVDGWRVDLCGFKGIEGVKDIRVRAKKLMIDYLRAIYNVALADNECICQNCGEIAKKHEMVGVYCNKCLHNSGGLLYRFDYHEYYGNYDIHEKVDTSKVPVFGCEIERDWDEQDDDDGNCSDFYSDKDSALDGVGSILYDGFTKKQQRDHVFMYDGSLNNGGIEWITFPHTYKWYKANKNKIQRALDEFESWGFGNSSNVGNHIHINRDYFGKSAKYCAAKMSVLMSKYWGEFKAIANRTHTDYTSCPSQTADDDIFTICEKTIENENEHSIAINLQHCDTIECRIWSGIDNASDLLFALDFMQSLAKFVKVHDLERVQKTSFAALFKYMKDKDNISIAVARLRRYGFTIAANTLQALYLAEV